MHTYLRCRYATLGVRENGRLEQFCFHVHCIHFRRAVFVYVRLAQLCTRNGVSFYMCSAVELAWLAQKIRQSSTRTCVISSAVALRCLW